MTPRTVDKQAKRTAILHAALPVLARQGVHTFKMIDVANAAGVGKGTLYEYFDSKESLIRATFTQLMADYGEFVAGEVARAGDPEGQLKRLLAASCTFFSREQARLELLFDLWASAGRRDSAHKFLDPVGPLYEEWREWLAGIIRDGIKQRQFRQTNVRLTASLILASIDGLMFQAALGLIDLADTRVVRTVNQTLLKGIAL